MSLRVISGDWHGRPLEAPPGTDTRPLTDRIKQSLFDWLGQRMDDWRVADVCAGSGAFGIEAASRGAKEVHLIENGRHAIPTLRTNLKMLGDPPQVRLLTEPFQTALPRLKELDLVFCDPPFPWFTDRPESLEKMMTMAAAAISAEGQVLIRGEERQKLPASSVLRIIEQREYGRSWIARLGE